MSIYLKKNLDNLHDKYYNMIRCVDEYYSDNFTMSFESEHQIPVRIQCSFLMMLVFQGQ